MGLTQGEHDWKCGVVKWPFAEFRTKRIMNTSRRRFLEGLTAAALLRASRAAAEPFPVHFRHANPYDARYSQIAPGHDEFMLEVEAERRSVSLNRLLQARSATADVPAEFQAWLSSLGPVRRSQFFVLPDGVVRYEIATTRQGTMEYRVGHWKLGWEAERVRSAVHLDEQTAHASEPLFLDVTGDVFAGCDSFQQQLQRGIPFWRSRLDSASGIDIYGMNGVSVADIDNDGRDEIFVCQPGGLPNRLYKFAGERLEDITEEAGLALLDDSTCALFLDLRNSGRQDLVLMRSAGPLLFLNDGSGRFAARPDAFRFATPPAGTFTGMAAADYDRDGKLDLYLCTYSFFQSEDQYRYAVPYYDARNGPPNFLFRNDLNQDGSGYFEDVTAKVGLNENNNRFSFAPAWCDFDGDGWPDLCVANDFGRKNLYKNEAGRFHDVAGAAGVDDAGPGMSAAWFDYDGDGKPDLYVSNMWTATGQRLVHDSKFHPDAGGAARRAYETHARGNSLYRNRGDGTFESCARREGVEMGRWAWSADGVDFDNDGTPEIFVTCGMLTNSRPEDLEGFFWRQVVARSPAAAVRSEAYENGWNAINQFVREEYSWSGRQENVFYVRRGNRYEDYSGVSGLDAAQDSRAFAVLDFDNDGCLDLVLKSRLGPQVRVFRNNSGQGRRSLAFSLRGTKSNRDAIGARIEVDGQVKFLNAGSGYLSQHSKRVGFGLGERAAAKQVRIVWPSGVAQEFHDLDAGFVYRIEEGSSHFSKTPFERRVGTAPGAAVAAGVNAPEFADTWLIDPVPLPDRRAGPGLFCIGDEGTKLPAGIAGQILRANQEPEDVIASYALFRRYLFDVRAAFTLPLVLLLDERGAARKIYAQMPGAGTVKADLAALGNPDSWRAALPFRGDFFYQPRRNFFRLGAAFLWAGYPERSLQYLEEEVRRSPGNAVALMAIAQIHLEANRMEPARKFADDALRVNPSLAGAWNTLGGVALEEGKFEEALTAYRRAMSIQPDMRAAVVNAAQTYARLSRTAEAEELFRKALAMDPGDSETCDQLGLLLAKDGRNAEARQWLQKAIELQKDNTSAINNLGVLYMQMGQTRDAVAAFQYGIERAPGDETLYFNLAKTYVKMGDRGRARVVLQQLLSRKPGNTLAARALAELEKLE
jgi:Flp pilus assembly protein TadD